MAEQLEPIIEETSQVTSITTSPAHEYLEVISNVEDSDTTITAESINDSPVHAVPVPVNNEIEPATVCIGLQAQCNATDVTQNSRSRHSSSGAMGLEFSVSGTNISQQTITQPELVKYDPELKEYMESTFNTLTSLVNGINVGPDNWVLLLTKAMYVVSVVKSLDADKKIRLSVDLVIRYLDDYTELEESILVSIKSSVRAMCIAILNNTGVLGCKVTTPAVIRGDPDVLANPLQITDLVIKKLINLVKSRGLEIQGIKSLLPELVILCITTVEKYPHFTGLEKKNLVIQIIQKFLTDYVPLVMTISNDEKAGLEVLSQSLPFLVDTLVNVGRGKVNYKFNFSTPETLSKMQLLSICLLSCIKRHY